MKPQRGRAVAIVAAVIALLVLLGSGFLVARTAGWLPDRWAPRQRSSVPRASNFRGGVDLASGTIELAEFLRFLGDYTGLPVVFDSADPGLLKSTLTVVAPVNDLDAEVVRSLIEANGFTVEVETLGNGKQIIRIVPTQERRSP